MEKAEILEKQKDLSIQWFEQIRKTVRLPHEPNLQIYHSIKPPDYVTVLTRTKQGKYIVLRQYRPAVEDYTLELPSGHVERGENPSEAARRELAEETGCIAKSVKSLGNIIPDTGRLENRLWAFFADCVELNGFPDPTKNEGIEVHLVTHEELFQMICEGKLNHALDLSVIAMAVFRKYLIL